MENDPSKNRGYLLPKGCKDLIDVLNLKETAITPSYKPKVNGQIKAPQIRVIEAGGKQLGIMSVAAALNLAAERRLDLVLIAPNANPPICYLIDYGRYQFKARKRRA